MDRKIIYPGQVPMETDLLQTNQYSMLGLSKLAAAVLGLSTVVNGFATTQTVVPSLAVLVAPGEIYSVQNLEATAYSSLPADTAHSIVKQGVSLDAQTIAVSAPGTAGFSVNYLIQAAYQETDIGSTVLPYYNASNPAVAYSGPANSGAAQPTTRKGGLVINAKAGIAAATGTQTTPAPDSGYVGLYVVTVANGASSVVNANIREMAGAPIIRAPLRDLFKIAGGGVTTVVAGATTLTSENAGLVLVNAAAGNVTLTLPAANTLASLPFTFRRIDSSANTVTVNRAGADTIDEGATSFTLVNQGDVREVVSDGVSAWRSRVGPFSILKNQQGYMRLPGGLIMQWGSVNAGNATSVSFPMAFPTGYVAITPCLVIPSGVTGPVYAVETTNANASGFILYVVSQPSSGGAWTNATHAVTWIAFGY
jgi:hypothetical protein